MKIAVFGGCLTRGIASWYDDTGAIQCKKIEPNICMFLQEKCGCPVLNYGMRRSGVHYTGNVRFPNEEHANPLNSIQNRVLNTNLKGVTHVIVWASTNDYGKSVTAEHYKTAIESIINYIKGLRIKLLFITPSPRYSFKGDPTTTGFDHKNLTGLSLNDYTDIIINTSDTKQVSYIDFRSQPYVTDDNHRHTLPDGLHPTPEINQSWLEWIYYNILNFINDY